MAQGTCSVDDCDRPVVNIWGMCSKHYQRWRTGAPNRKGLVCIDCGGTYDAKYKGVISPCCAPCAKAREAKKNRGRELRNFEAYRAWHHEYNIANREKHREQKRAARLASPEKYRENVRRRYARKKGNGVFLVTEVDLRRLLVRQQNRCFYCHDNLDAKKHLDHIVPLARGGRHAIGNLAYACVGCNQYKSARHLADFRRESWVRPLTSW